MLLRDCAFSASETLRIPAGTVQWGNLSRHATCPCALCHPEELGLPNSEGGFPYIVDKGVFEKGRESDR